MRRTMKILIAVVIVVVVLVIVGKSVNGKLYLSHLGKKGNEYLSHPTKPL